MSELRPSGNSTPKSASYLPTGASYSFEESVDPNSALISVYGTMLYRAKEATKNKSSTDDIMKFVEFVDAIVKLIDDLSCELYKCDFDKLNLSEQADVIRKSSPIVQSAFCMAIRGLESAKMRQLAMDAIKDVYETNQQRENAMECKRKAEHWMNKAQHWRNAWEKKYGSVTVSKYSPWNLKKLALERPATKESAEEWKKAAECWLADAKFFKEEAERYKSALEGARPSFQSLYKFPSISKGWLKPRSAGIDELGKLGTGFGPASFDSKKKEQPPDKEE